MAILVIADHDNRVLRSATLNTVTAALQCNGEVHVLVAGHRTEAVAQAAAQVTGVSKVLLADAPWLGNQLAENVCAQVLALANGYTHLLFPATTQGKNVAPRVAALLDAAQISEVSKVLRPDAFERAIYAGNVIATVECADAIKVVTVRTTGFDAATATGGKAIVQSVTPTVDTGLSVYVGSEINTNDRPDLEGAAIVISGGRGLGSAEKFSAVLVPLADKLGAALGASRAAVDAGYAPNDLQVGQTGKIVAPKLYVAIGISGAIQI